MIAITSKYFKVFLACCYFIYCIFSSNVTIVKCFDFQDIFSVFVTTSTYCVVSFSPTIDCVFCCFVSNLSIHFLLFMNLLFLFFLRKFYSVTKSATSVISGPIPVTSAQSATSIGSAVTSGSSFSPQSESYSSLSFSFAKAPIFLAA